MHPINDQDARVCQLIAESLGTNDWLSHAARECFQFLQEGRFAKRSTGDFLLVYLFVYSREVDYSSRICKQEECIQIKVAQIYFYLINQCFEVSLVSDYMF